MAAITSGDHSSVYDSNLTPYNLSLAVVLHHYCQEDLVDRVELAGILWELVKYRNLSLNELIAALNGQEKDYDYSFGDEFLGTLEAMFQEPTLGKLQTLVGHFGTIHSLMIALTIYLRPSSVFGRFLMHLTASFEMASFEELTQVLADIKLYYSNRDTVFPVRSVRQQRALICADVAKFQRSLVMDTSNTQIWERARALVKDGKMQQAEYLHYLNFLSLKEYNLAKHHLHQYFTMMLNNADESKNIRPFSALNLGAMHSFFGHKEIAIRYLKESIHLSELLGEKGCLSHCIGWMSYLQGSPMTTPTLSNDSDPVHSDLELLSHCHVTEKQCRAGESSDVILKHLCDIGPFLSRPQFNTNASQIFRWYGNSFLSELYPFFALFQLCPNWSPDSHIITFSQEAAGLCIALCNIALVLSKTDCPLTQSTDLLNFTKTLFPPFSSEQDLITLTLNKIRFVHSHKDDGGADPGVIMRSISPRMYDALTRTTLHDVDVEVEEGETSTDSLNDKYITAVEYKAHVLYNAAVAKATLGAPEQALDTLLTLILHCEQFNLLEMEIKAYLLLAETQLRLQLFRQASETVQAVLVEALASHDTQVQCTGRWVYAQTEVALAELGDRKPVFQTVSSHIKTALEGFTALKARDRVLDVLYFMTRMYHELGMKEQRNRYAKRFSVYHKTQILEEI